MRLFLITSFFLLSKFFLFSEALLAHPARAQATEPTKEQSTPKAQVYVEAHFIVPKGSNVQTPPNFKSEKIQNVLVHFMQQPYAALNLNFLAEEIATISAPSLLTANEELSRLEVNGLEVNGLEVNGLEVNENFFAVKPRIFENKIEISIEQNFMNFGCHLPVHCLTKINLILENGQSAIVDGVSTLKVSSLEKSRERYRMLVTPYIIRSSADLASVYQGKLKMREQTLHKLGLQSEGLARETPGAFSK